MGQSQSSNGGTPQNEGQTKTDYYELLGVERQATDEEIKKAYRRKALELHPDRNYGNVEQATRLFAEIQSAYEILSDAQERAWYDSHRDVFLRGSQPGQQEQDEFSYNIRMTTADDVLKLMMKYNGRLDYSDSSTGFYGGLREFFAQLAKEEEIACKWENLDPVEYPDFGQKEDDYDDVVKHFYAGWNGFATRKSYSWKDHYRLSDAPDRRVRRLMEKENKSLREEAVREFNDAVRSLIAFVRKRDPRYQENQKSEEERQKILRDAAAAQSMRSRAARQAKLDELDRQTVPDWAKSTTVVEHEGGFSSEVDSEQHEIECVVCNKTFKSEAQYEAHEKSKKHVKLLKQLQREMRAQDHDIKESNVQMASPMPEQHTMPDPEEDGEVTENGVPAAQSDETDLHPAETLEQDDDVTRDARYEEPTSERDDDDYAPRAEVEGRLANPEPEDLANHLKSTVIGDTPSTSDAEVSSAPKVGKAKQKRAKKAAQKDASPGTTGGSDFKCVVCRADFPSKSKLFTHIKEKGHAAPITVTAARGGKTAKGEKRW